MKKTIFITLLCASLMLVTPLTSVAQENKVSSNLTDNPDINGLIVQIRIVVNEILEKYGHIPMFRSLCDSILNTLGLLGDLTICIILIITLFLTAPFIWDSYFLWSLTILCLLLLDDYCPPYDKLISKLPLQSLYTLSQTNDLTNTFDDCPCLQE